MPTPTRPGCAHLGDQVQTRELQSQSQPQPLAHPSRFRSLPAQGSVQPSGPVNRPESRGDWALWRVPWPPRARLASWASRYCHPHCPSVVPQPQVSGRVWKRPPLSSGDIHTSSLQSCLTGASPW